MERLRYVARAGGGDPAVVVSETVEAVRGLAPGPGELVSVCRNLVERNITCGPLWWLCANLLSEPEALARSWDLADEIAEDPTGDHLVAAVPDDATVLTIGYPVLAARALTRRGDLTVLAVEAGHASNALIRLLDRNDVEAVDVPPEALLAAMSRADVVLLEADACSTSTAVSAIGSGLAAIAAHASATPVWLVAGRGRRLPTPFLDSITRRVSCDDSPWESEFEAVPLTAVAVVAGPNGVVPATTAALGPECPLVPELVTPPG